MADRVNGMTTLFNEIPSFGTRILTCNSSSLQAAVQRHPRQQRPSGNRSTNGLLLFPVFGEQSPIKVASRWGLLFLSLVRVSCMCQDLGWFGGSLVTVETCARTSRRAPARSDLLGSLLRDRRVSDD